MERCTWRGGRPPRERPSWERLGGHLRGFDYLLEVDLVLDVLETWSWWRGGQTPTAEAIIHYAETDAYLPAV